MPVDSQTFKIVFCEGKPNSLDYLVLARILPVGRVRIRPIGGKYALRAYIQGYLATYPDSAQPAYIAFCDRDFDAEPPDLPQLMRTQSDRPLWMGHRAAIENYLIDADLLWKYWEDREATPGWKYGPAPSKSKIEAHIEESAHQIADYQAVRWALARLKPGSRWPEVRTTWMESSGKLPQSLIYDDCLDQACQLAESFQSQVQGITSNLLKEKAAHYRTRFSDESFWQKRSYLVWFHGKDHLTRLCNYLAPNFPRRNYEEWAAEHIELGKYPDLLQLVKEAH